LAVIIETTKKKNMEGEKSVQAWIDGVKSEHCSLAIRIANLIRELIPNVQCTTKWHKPSYPLGIPFYGIQDKG
jgi:hypothetical protein